MNERRRQIQFPSPLDCPELELDPEKKLWIPGKKKFFIPANPKVTTIDMSWDLETPHVRPISLSIPNLFELYAREADFARDFYARMAECVPGRDEFIVPTNERQQQPPRTYGEIRRSSTPMFRNHLRRNW